MPTRRKNTSTQGTLATIHEHLTYDDIVRQEKEIEKASEKERRRKEAILSARQQYQEEEIEKMHERTQEAKQAIDDLKERHRLAEEAERIRLAKRSKGWFGCMSPFGSCAMGATRKRKLNSKKKPKPKSKKKRKPRATTNKRRNTRRTGR